ncbi:glycosyltransferase family 4 protein [Anabaena sphaerica FACHB-251]|uniref:Glycosyltransferase family 4 protein n=2 Tax=Anabaena TaxID=1163 RepID=A0A926WD14_9NOST|nr:glycosyltransferase family 4 protein [Anabaena sphaerica FACHB-251]
MIKVAALTDNQTQSSSRFRVRQHIELLRQLGVYVTDYYSLISGYELTPSWTPKSLPSNYEKPVRYFWQGAKLANRIPGIIGSYQSDITWLLRGLLPHHFTFEPLLKHPLVFDVDDAIWLINHSRYSSDSSIGIRTAKSIMMIAKQADIVIAGNNYLAQWFEQCNSNIKVIPTAVDTQRYHPKNLLSKKLKPFTIGWIGSDIRDLLSAEMWIKRFMLDFVDSELLIIAGQIPLLNNLPSDRVKYIPWSPEVEVEAIQQMDVGLMPLENSEFSKGKCSFKMLQYMACGIPVIVSSVGMNLEILALGEVGIGVKEQETDWYDALVMLYQNRELGDKYGIEGRKIVEQHFSQTVIVEKLAIVFRELV